MTLKEWNDQPRMVAFSDLPKKFKEAVYEAEETIPYDKLESATEWGKKKIKGEG